MQTYLIPRLENLILPYTLKPQIFNQNNLKPRQNKRSCEKEACAVQPTLVHSISVWSSKSISRRRRRRRRSAGSFLCNFKLLGLIMLMGFSKTHKKIRIKLRLASEEFNIKSTCVLKKRLYLRLARNCANVILCISNSFQVSHRDT